MNCWHCETELIWGGDQDIDVFENDEYSRVTNLSCPKCKSVVFVYMPHEHESKEEIINKYEEK